MERSIKLLSNLPIDCRFFRHHAMSEQNLITHAIATKSLLPVAYYTIDTGQILVISLISINYTFLRIRCH